jgi:hypothetical protein
MATEPCAPIRQIDRRAAASRGSRRLRRACAGRAPPMTRTSVGGPCPDARFRPDEAVVSRLSGEAIEPRPLRACTARLGHARIPAEVIVRRVRATRRLIRTWAPRMSTELRSKCGRERAWGSAEDAGVCWCSCGVRQLSRPDDLRLMRVMIRPIGGALPVAPDPGSHDQTSPTRPARGLGIVGRLHGTARRRPWPKLAPPY